MIHLTINGKAVAAPDGATILDAALAGGIHIPTLCRFGKMHEYGTCRICVVEVEGAKTLQASCMTPAMEGMVVHTHTEAVRQARKVLYELIVSDHSMDCLTCRRNQDCELQELGRTLGVETTRFEGEQSARVLDVSPSITRDMSKCILCRRCVTVCGQVQGVGVLNAQNRGFATEIGPAMDLALGSVNCSFCGQCTVVCPVGALKETDATERVWQALHDPKKRTVVQVAPAVRVALGEPFGAPVGTRVTGKIPSALRELGFDDVFDTNFTADLTIIEEGTELLGRLKAAVAGGGATLPMITSCSPGWIKHVEHAWPKRLAHLSTCKSPHAMLGALAKSWYARRIGVDPADMFVVSVMPCTAKKFEITRPEMKNDGVPNVDAVLTTRELASMLKEAGVDLLAFPESDFDIPLGLSTGAADIFGMTGGVMEAALRTVYELVTGRELPFVNLHVTPVEGLEQVKEATVHLENLLPEYAFLEGIDVRVAVTSGLAGARRLMDQVEAGSSPYHFIEVMGCPGGCLSGGGQPRSEDPQVKEKRLAAILAEDEGKPLRKSHENPSVTALYHDFLESPNSAVAHEYLHTHYTQRGTFNELGSRADLPAAVRTAASRRKQAARLQPAGVETGTVPVEAAESVKLLALEAENLRLKGELADALETVDIFKQVVSSYNSR